MYDLEGNRRVPLQGSTDHSISFVNDMVISPAGFIALRGDKKILVYDFRYFPIGFRPRFHLLTFKDLATANIFLFVPARVTHSANLHSLLQVSN
jgi:hypothetical protein